MDKTLEITWDGDVPGLAEHRLSIDAFGKALQQLLVAYRRIASNLIMQASSEKGRLKRETDFLDLEIGAILSGSSGIAAACVLREPVSSGVMLFDTLTDRAATALLTDIEAEAHGQPRNGQVRKFLRLLPDGLTRQHYRYINNGFSKEVKFGSLVLTEETEMPIVHTRMYALVGAGFEPGKSYVRLKGAEDHTMHCSATPKLVNQALELRHGSVYATVVKQRSKTRLLRIWRAGEDLRPISEEQADHLLFGKWHQLLTRLAE